MTGRSASTSVLQVGEDRSTSTNTFEGFVCEWARNVGVGAGGSVGTDALEVVGKQVRDAQRFGTGADQTFAFKGVDDEQI